MEKIINKPIAETFGWLHVGGTKVLLPEETDERKISLLEGESRTVAIEDNGALLSIEAELEKDAVLNLILVRRADAADKSIADIRVTCRENASFHWYRVVLGGGETYDNCSVSLEGKGSTFTADLGYRLQGTEKYDVNCEAIHLGKHSESRIRSFGALSEQAGKLLRGTIDFRKGCSGAVGNEAEDVLLLDDTVRNQSVPVILCSEEDVVGNHGATIGRPDEKILYYVASRGIDEETAIELLAQSKLDAVISQIPDEEVQRRIKEA